MKSNLLKNIEDICEQTRVFFCAKYFGKGTIGYWTANRIGSKLHVGDYIFTLEDMFDFLKNNASRDQMFGYIEYFEETEQLGKEPLNFKSWKCNLKK
jgi:hypothetical protein